jgi:enamine deaminase RidA (YjgF/YER057c/UK114 family)
MEKRTINPWTWQERAGFQQAVETTGAERVLWCAGQTSLDADGEVVGDDMATQIAQSLDNLETVLAEAGMTLANVVRVTWYVTSVAEFREASSVRQQRFAEGGCQAASTLVQVAGLAFPELRVEITATAVA